MSPPPEDPGAAKGPGVEGGSWLVRDGVVLASLEVARGARGRARGLLGRDGIDGAILLDPCRSVHTLGMRFTIDVAFCTRDLEVVRVVTLPPRRAAVALRARCVIEATEGAMAEWGVAPGDRLEIR